MLDHPGVALLCCAATGTQRSLATNSSQSRESTDDEDTDIESPPVLRGRRYSLTLAPARKRSPNFQRPSSSVSRPRRASPANSSSESSAPISGLLRARAPFTRSRSPAVSVTSTGIVHRISSPVVSSFPRHRSSLAGFIYVFPADFEINVSIPFTSYSWNMSVDARKAGESLILIGSLVYASSKIWEGTNFHSPNFDSQQYNLWVLTGQCRSQHPQTSCWYSLELHCLVGATVLYVLWLSNSLISSKANPFTSLNADAAAPSMTSKRPSSPRIPETRDSNFKRNVPLLLRKRADFGFVWMSVPRNYRESSDDGILTGLLFGPLVSSALLYSSLTLPSSATPLSSWRIEAPRLLSNAKDSYSALEALVLSRYNLVDLSNLCSTILLLHVCASWWFESRYRVAAATLDSERKSVPRSAGKRLSYFVVFTLGITICMLGIKFALVYFSLGIWQRQSSVAKFCRSQLTCIFRSQLVRNYSCLSILPVYPLRSRPSCTSRFYSRRTWNS